MASGRERAVDSVNGQSGQGMAHDFRQFFAELFARLDAVPKRQVVKLLKGGCTLDLVQGEPKFIAADGSCAQAAFRRRYLAVHPVPLSLRAGDRLTLVPTTGNRVMVRRSTLWERLFG